VKEPGIVAIGSSEVRWRSALALFITAVAVYSLFSYAGIRSPDSEIVYRTAHALAFDHTFAVAQGLEGWEEFALVRGLDGNLYPLFQPLEPLLLAPWVRMAEPLSRKQWVQDLLPNPAGSHYVKEDIPVMLGAAPDEIQPHIARALVMPFNVLVSALSVLVFYFLVQALTGIRKAALLSGVAYGFCTLNLSYAGTLFKEPLMNLFVLGSLGLLVASRGSERPAGRAGLLAASGFVMSLALATHLMAVPMIPCFALLAGALHCRGRRRWAPFVLGAATWCLAVVPVSALLAWYNAARFGSVFRAGYCIAVNQALHERFHSPVAGMSGLLFSAGKGLFLYCPIVLVAAAVWRPFHRREPVLSVFVIVTVLVRFVFAASYNDWHGGFSMGPRFMVNLVPLLLLSFGFWTSTVVGRPVRGRVAALFGVLWVCLCQQMYFAMGEVFSYLHAVKWEAGRAGVDVFKGHFLYFSWKVSPLLHLFEGVRGPFLLGKVPLSDCALLGILCALAFLLLLTAFSGMLERIPACSDDRPGIG